MPVSSQPASEVPPAIVLVAFGTRSDQGREVFGVIEQAARRRYPGHEVLMAFSSGVVVERLQKSGVAVRGPHETLEILQARGYRKAVLQSLMIAKGRKHAELACMSSNALQIICGPPLLAGPDDIPAVLEAIAPAVPEDRPTVFVTHGSEANAADRTWHDFAANLERRFDNAVVCSLKGFPGLTGLTRARQLAQKCQAVHFVPLMLTSGGHIEKDVLGETPDSWKNRIGVPSVSCSPPLGYNPAIQDILFRHLDTALAALAAHPTS